MPVYEYRCEKGHEYEKWEGFEAPPEQACLRCGNPARRLISPPAVIFKGRGFYSTDYRKSEGKDGAKAKTDEGYKQESKASDSDSGKPQAEAV